MKKNYHHPTFIQYKKKSHHFISSLPYEKKNYIREKKKCKEAKKIKLDISKSGCEPDPILLDQVASQAQYRWIWLPHRIWHLLEVIWIGSACQARLTSF
jgi:hypothetical protein